MSKSMKILLGAFGGVAAVAVLLTMLGILDLPLGPLNGMLAGDDEIVADGSTDPALGGAGLGTQLCDPVTGLPIDGSGAGAVDPAAGTTDPAAGAADPAAGGVDPAAGAIDPATGAPVAAPADGWDGSARVIAAGDDAYDASRIPDSWVVAADVDPTTGAPIDPSAGGVTDPAASTGAVDPLADPAAAGGAADPAAADPNAGAAGGAVNGVPCDQVAGAAGAGGADAGAIADPTAGGAGVDPSAAAGAGAGAGAGAAAGGAAATGAGRSTTDGTNSGNNPEALRAAKDASSVMQKAKITVSTTATLVPGTGGVGRPAAVRKYRGTVTGATLVMKLDASAMQQWTGAGKKVQTDLVKSFITRLGKSYRKAVRSITIVDDQGNVLAIGDASANGGAARVKLF